MQLWLKEVTTEYAMNKPEGEIWPDTKLIKKRAWRVAVFGENAYVKIEVAEEPGEFEFDDSNVYTDYIETHRTHCPECWQKYEGSVYLGTEMGGHRAFHCAADYEYDDRFPREG